MTIYYNNHHIIPKHIGGTDDPENIIRLTIPEHAEAHRKLYEEHGRWQDKIAWKALSGQITHYEAKIEAIKKTQTGRKHTPEHRAKILETRKGYRHTEETKKKIGKSNEGKIISEYNRLRASETHKGKKLTDEHKEIMRQTHKGKPKSLAQRKKMAASGKLAWEKRRLRMEG
jgi:hypothetical protein